MYVRSVELGGKKSPAGGGKAVAEQVEVAHSLESSLEYGGKDTNSWNDRAESSASRFREDGGVSRWQGGGSWLQKR